MFDRPDPLFQNGLVLFSPAVQHIGVSLDHRDRCAELMGGIRHKTGLLSVGIPHAVDKIIHCLFQPLQLLVPDMKMPPAFFWIYIGNGILQKMKLTLIKGDAAQFFRLFCQLIQWVELIPDLLRTTDKLKKQ